MDSTLEPARPEPAKPEPALTHDAIVALLRDHPPRSAHDPSELNIAPGREETVTAAPSIAPAIDVAPAPPAFEPIPPAPAAEPIALTPPLEPPLRTTPKNDVQSDIKMDAELHQPPARAGRGLLRFVAMVFVGIGATIAWQVYGETAREKLASAMQLLEAAP